MITLYSTHCPKCLVLSKKLVDADIDFEINSNVEEMLALGLMEAPALKVGDKLMNFREALNWIGEQQIGN